MAVTKKISRKVSNKVKKSILSKYRTKKGSRKVSKINIRKKSKKKSKKRKSVKRNRQNLKFKKTNSILRKKKIRGGLSQTKVQKTAELRKEKEEQLKNIDIVSKDIVRKDISTIKLVDFLDLLNENHPSKRSIKFTKIRLSQKENPTLDQYKIPDNFNVKKLYSLLYPSVINSFDFQNASELSIWKALLLENLNPNQYGYYNRFENNIIQTIQINISLLSKDFMKGGAFGEDGYEIPNQLVNGKNRELDFFSVNTLRTTSCDQLFHCSLPLQKNEEKIKENFLFMQNKFGIKNMISLQACALAMLNRTNTHLWTNSQISPYANCQFLLDKNKKARPLTVDDNDVYTQTGDTSLYHIQDELWTGKKPTESEIKDWENISSSENEILREDIKFNSDPILYNILMEDFTPGSIESWKILFAYYINNIANKSSSRKTCIHCWGGLGRTGAVVLLFLLLDDIYINKGESKMVEYLKINDFNSLYTALKLFHTEHTGKKDLTQSLIDRNLTTDETDTLNYWNEQFQENKLQIEEFHGLGFSITYVSRVNIIFMICALFCIILGLNIPYFYQFDKLQQTASSVDCSNGKGIKLANELLTSETIDLIKNTLAI